MIGVGRLSSTSFYSEPRASVNLAHDQVLLQLHTDCAIVPVWAHRLGLVAKPLAVPTWDQVVAHVNRHDYIKHASVESYQRELYAAIDRRYGQTLRKWCDEINTCVRCGRAFRWLTSIGQWRCRYHTGVPLDEARMAWSCCVHRGDLSLEQRLYGCMRCDHTTFQRESAEQQEPDTLRLPLVLMDKLCVRNEALMTDCLIPWSITTTDDSAPRQHRCSASHVLATVMLASDDATRQVSVPFDGHAAQSSSSRVTPIMARERCCMISLFETPTVSMRQQLTSDSTTTTTTTVAAATDYTTLFGRTSASSSSHIQQQRQSRLRIAVQ